MAKKNVGRQNRAAGITQAKPGKVRVSGKLDTVSDYLKQVLFNKGSKEMDQLQVELAELLAGQPLQARVERNLKRYLERNPCFVQLPDRSWKLDLDGNRGNDQVYQWLLTLARPLTVMDLQQLANENSQPGNKAEAISQIQEKALVQDGRFIRLHTGRWALVYWQVVRGLGGEEVTRVCQYLARAATPLSADELSLHTVGCRARLTDLVEHLQRDPRFVWVGGVNWYLRELLPDFTDYHYGRERFKGLYEDEEAVLQEAELLLILNDTEAGRREYVLASSDVLSGHLRVTKRLERLFINLPPLALLDLRTPGGDLKVWYSREARVLSGLGDWFKENELGPGSRLALKRLGNAVEVKYSLEAIGEWETEVRWVGLKILKLERLARDGGGQRVESLVAELLEVFSEGLAEEELASWIKDIQPIDASAVGAALRTFPFFEVDSRGIWRVNSSVRLAYEYLQRQFAQVEEALREARLEAAASLEAVGKIRDSKDRLEGEMIYLEKRLQDDEARSKQDIAKLSSLKERLRRDNEKLKQDMEELYAREDSLREEIAHLEVQNATLREERNMLQQRLAELETRGVQLQGVINRTAKGAENELTRVKEKLRDQENQLISAILARDELARQVENLRREQFLLQKRLAPWPVRFVAWLWTAVFGLSGQTAK